MKNYISISEVEARTVIRISTGQDELDWLYGVSKFGPVCSWGMPVATISTWCGEGGVGKSRLAIDVAKAKVEEGSTVLYFQNEVDLPTLASWVNNNSLKNFYCSEVTALAEQVEAVSQAKPDLVFVDSINLVDEYGTGTAKSIKKIIDAFRKVIRGTNCHVVILCQLNKEGSATGSTALGHLPDTNLTLTNFENDFKVAIGKKNRYGPKGSEFFGIWRHTDTGVECVSSNRLRHGKWCEAHDMVGNGRPELPDIDWDAAAAPHPIISDFGVRRQKKLDLSEFYNEFPASGLVYKANDSLPLPVMKLSDSSGKIKITPAMRDALAIVNGTPKQSFFTRWKFGHGLR